MLKLKKFWILPALIAISMSIPAGLSNMFLPSVITSSLFDEERVYTPIISFQVILLLLYCLAFIGEIKLGCRDVILAISLIFLCVVCSLMSNSPGGYLSYSLIWLLTPFAIFIHYKTFGLLANDALPYTLNRIASFFLPLYVFDLVISLYFFGIEEFTSFALASNGHTFVSMLMFLLLQINSSKAKIGNRIDFYKISAVSVYLIGGLLSQGRVAIMAMFLAVILLNLSRAKKILPFIIISFSIIAILNEKINSVVVAMWSGDFENPVVWSSMISRLKFWSVFWDIFEAYPIAGAGGIASNLIKYDFNFPYQVYVDPHNEFIFILSGFGISGFLFLLNSLALSNSLFEFINAKNERYNFDLKVIIFYILICSVTNANSAKQNIEIIICFVILFSMTQIIFQSGKKFSPSVAVRTSSAKIN